MCHYTKLVVLSIGANRLEGQIPRQFSTLTKMKLLSSGVNNLFGTIPPWIGNCSSVFRMSLAKNNFQGSIPTAFGRLSKLKVFTVYDNYLTEIDLSQNNLTGKLLDDLGSLKDLVILNFDDNILGSGKVDDLSFINFLANCTGLSMLGIAGNHFGGVLPSSISYLSNQYSQA
ncbi:probable LRR receptor-like serine/threonine-protein kinase At3g47570 [Benincasa hispida]|uniref:probable LRR receptor-like serine/threonine-protein kinase At3g47570 n=1 Tax=Benincasa hispida TaxID=102211 RepID=UPI0018FF9DE9|nr:probable LRR receptor-like serine/threonine-protein kinase At3g47570 [Benincasa hispida]